MANENDLKNLLRQYWIEGKRQGKHETMPVEHFKLLNSTLKAKPEDLFNQIYENRFNPDEIKSNRSWEDFLNKAKLSEYLSPDYVKYGLEITSSRPAIGMGEFLFVSCYCNLSFAPGHGDLVMLDTHKRIEMKGKRSSLSGDKKGYKEMGDRVMTSVYSPFKQNAESAKHDHFSRSEARNLEEIIKKTNATDEQVTQMFMHLQNWNIEDRKLAEIATSYFRKTNDLFRITGAEHICIYMREEQADYLMLTNNSGYCCFGNPLANRSKGISEQDFERALFIADHITLSSWNAQSKGISINI